MRVKLELNSEIQFSGRKHKIVETKGTSLILQRTEGDLETQEFSIDQIVNDPSFKDGNKKTIRKEREVLEEGKYVLPLEKLNDDEHVKKRDEISWKYNLILPLLLLERIKIGDLKALIEFEERFSKVFLKLDEKVKNITQEELIKRIIDKARNSEEMVQRSTIMRYLKAYRDHQLTGGRGSGVECFIRTNDKEYRQRADTFAIEICSPRYPDEVVDVIYTKYPPEYHSLIKVAIEKKYLNTRRLKITKVTEYIESLCLIAKLKPIPDITVRIMIKQLSERTIGIFRHGRKGSDVYTHKEKGYSEKAALYPLHVVQIDHTKLDIIAIHEETGLALGRPFITLGIDVFSRVIWCMHLSFDDPSSAKVRKAFIQGLFSKNSKTRYGTTNDWPIFGIPSIIYLDNGSDFTSKHVKQMINETLESEVRYRPRKTPHYGGVIERLMGSINGILSELPGYTGPNIMEKGDRDPSEEACMTLKEIEQFISKWIVDVYHFKEHRGLPDDCNVPILRYEAGCRDHGNPDFFPHEEKEIIKLSLLPSAKHPYTKLGVTKDHIEYKAGDLSHLIAKRETKYTIKYDDDDLSRIYLQLPSTSEFVTIPATYPKADELEGLTRFEWKKVKNNLREQGLLTRREKLTNVKVKAGRKELREKVEEAITKSKKARKTSEKLKMYTAAKAENENTGLSETKASKTTTESLLADAARKFKQRSESK